MEIFAGAVVNFNVVINKGVHFMCTNSQEIRLTNVHCYRL